MGSVTARASILATVITVLFVPITNRDGDVIGHMTKRAPNQMIRCAPLKRIPATARAKRLRVAGKVCRKRIVVRYKTAPRVKRSARR